MTPTDRRPLSATRRAVSSCRRRVSSRTDTTLSQEVGAEGSRSDTSAESRAGIRPSAQVEKSLYRAPCSRPTCGTTPAGPW